jgi:hypothetical protein
MPTQVSIVNQALGLLNANRITAFGINTREEQLATDSYDDLRDAVLEEADWTFAQSTLVIAPDAAPPVSTNWTAKYLIPNDVLRVLTVNGNRAGRPWKREGQYILTNYGTCEAVVINQINNANLFSPMFVQALVYRIAWAWAIPITKSTKIRDQYKVDYVDLISEATTVDGMQGTPEKTGQGRLVDIRQAIGTNIAGPTV